MNILTSINTAEDTNIQAKYSSRPKIANREKKLQNIYINLFPNQSVHIYKQQRTRTTTSQNQTSEIEKNSKIILRLV